VEPGGLELPTDLGEGLTGVVLDDDRPAIDHAVHVEHAEANTFHVKRTNGDAERGAFLQERVARAARGLRLNGGHERLEALFRGESGISGGHKDVENTDARRW
jgi:hypothetical protein